MREKSTNLLLLALLPLLAGLIYYDGQNYDPALIDFKSSAATGEDKYLSSTLGGYARKGEIRRFTKTDLYEYVNGHAEFFISGGFKSLDVAEYGEADAPGALVTAEIYDMGNELQAYGVFAAENNISGAASGPDAKSEVNFPEGSALYSGRYYLKIRHTAAPTPALAAIKQTIIEKVTVQNQHSAAATPDGAASGKTASADFPAGLGKVLKERYIKEAYRGLGFLPGVREREYELNGDEFQVFMVTGSESELGALEEKFIDYFKKSETPYQKIDVDRKRRYHISDKYEGDWYLILTPGALFGIFGEPDPTLVNKF